MSRSIVSVILADGTTDHYPSDATFVAPAHQTCVVTVVGYIFDRSPARGRGSAVLTYRADGVEGGAYVLGGPFVAGAADDRDLQATSIGKLSIISGVTYELGCSFRATGDFVGMPAGCGLMWHCQ